MKNDCFPHWSHPVPNCVARLMSGIARAGLGAAMNWDAHYGGFRADSRLGLAGQPAGIRVPCAMSFLQAE